MIDELTGYQIGAKADSGDDVRAELHKLRAENAELLAALKGMSEMYSYCWDLFDGGLVCMEGNIPRFEAAHEIAHNLILKQSVGGIK